MHPQARGWTCRGSFGLDQPDATAAIQDVRPRGCLQSWAWGPVQARTLTRACSQD